jgi:lipopolysaccharide export system protein LptA
VRRRAAAAALVLALLAATAAEAQAPVAPRRPAAGAGQGAEPDRLRPGAGGLGLMQGERAGPVTVDADQLEALQKEGLVVFSGNVVASQNGSTHYADRIEVYLDPKGAGIVRMISSGNVRVVTRDCLMGSAGRAEYYDAEQRVVLAGNARVWRENDTVTGERITIYLAEDRSVVEGGKQERVKAVFNPRGQGEASGAAAGRPKAPPGSPCQ